MFEIETVNLKIDECGVSWLKFKFSNGMNLMLDVQANAKTLYRTFVVDNPPKSETVESPNSAKKTQPSGEHNKQSESLLCPKCGKMSQLHDAETETKMYCEVCKTWWKK